MKALTKVRILGTALLLITALPSLAQDLNHYKRVVRALSSSKYQGRGYARDGANKAGCYLEKEFRKAGVGLVERQPFTLDINTFPGKMKMSVDGRRLEAGRDFTLREFSPGVHGDFPLYFVDTLHYDSARLFADLDRPENRGAFVVCDFWFTYKHKEDFQRLQSRDGSTNAGLIYTWQTSLKFYKAYGERVTDKAIIWTLADVIEGAQRATFDIDNRFLKGYECFNVIAKVEGERHDSCYVFTAHYDHLGNMGRKVFYAGANDNASGTATIVTLAAHYARHRPPYDIWFVAFSGEDANLRGSTAFVNNPVVPLTQIRYLFNIDMIGDNNPAIYCETSDTGERGYQLFEAINAERHHFTAIKHGKLAANSDHYPFAVRHVPCIFFENEEGDAFQWYHTPQDDWQHAIFDSYEPVFRMVTDFIKRY